MKDFGNAYRKLKEERVKSLEAKKENSPIYKPNKYEPRLLQ